MDTQKSFATGRYVVTVTDTDHGTIRGVSYSCAPHGNTLPCERCNQDERAAFAAATSYTAYVDTSRGSVVTFGMAPLARITSLRIGRARYTPTGGRYRMSEVDAVAPDGSRWHGRTGGQLITLRRLAAR